MQSGSKEDVDGRFMALDVEQNEPLVRPPVKQKCTRGNIIFVSCMAAVLIFLIIMTAVFTGRRSGTGATPNRGPQFAVPPGALVGCTDVEALCLVAKPVPTPNEDYRSHPRKVSGSHGVVTSDQSRCADIGAAVLEEGGAAADAAVAVALCQGVVNPFASGVGGGHFTLVRPANGTAAEFINAREYAPGAATSDMYNGKGSSASLDGGLAIAVPLDLKGLDLLWRRHGRLPWSRLVAPAALIARHGFAAHPYFVYLVSGNATINRLRNDPLTRAAFLVRDPRDGAYRAPRVGELCCKRPALADTLEAVGKNGVSWLYEPSRLQTMASEIQAAGGIITEQDFLASEPRVEQPLQYTLPGPVPYTLLVPPPPSSGAVLALALSLVLGGGGSSGGSDTTSLQQMDPSLLAFRMVEAMKHAFAVRMALGDPGTPDRPFTNVTAVLADIANSSFVDGLRASINDSGVLPWSEYGGRWNPLAAGGVAPDDHGTSHLAVVDREGNAVSMTTTVNTGFGSNVISRSTGILFNNEMDDFSRPGTPNKYNLSASVANTIQPFKRPLSSMAPSMVLLPAGPPGAGPGAATGAATGGGGGAPGALRLVVGASNGPRIITGIMQTIIRILYLGQDPLAAVSASRLHHQWQPDTCLFEDYTLNGVAFTPDPDVIANLSAKGDVMEAHADQLGDVQAILVEGASGGAVAVADPRKDGAPAAARG